MHRYVFAGIYWESFLFVMLLTAKPCIPIKASVPPVSRFPSFNNPVVPDWKRRISPTSPINTEINFRRVITSSL